MKPEWIRNWLTKIAIVFFGMLPVSCHYALTGPLLWNHGSSYAFEAWIMGWLLSLGVAGLALWLCWQD